MSGPEQTSVFGRLEALEQRLKAVAETELVKLRADFEALKAKVEGQGSQAPPVETPPANNPPPA